MFLVLCRDQQAPTGWKPITLTAAETPEQAAREGNPGHTCEIAVVEWNPTLYTVAVEPTITPKVNEPDTEPEEEPE